MAPDAKSVKAIIRASRPKFKSREAKLAFAVHAFLLAEGYKLIAVGKRADEAAPDEELTEEVDPDGWDELGEVFAFRYLPGDGRKEGALQVQMQAVGDTLLVHWQPAGSQAPPETLDLRVPHYVAETPKLDDVDGYKNLQELLQKLDRALHVAPPTKQAAAADAPGTGSKTGGGVHAGTVAEPLERAQPPGEPAQRRSEGDADDLHADGRLPLPLPDAEPDMDDPDLEGIVFPPMGMRPLGVAPPPSAPGAADLVPPGMRAPGTSGGFGIPHIPPGPGLGGFGSGGMHVGPGDPLYGGGGGLRMPGGGAGGRGGRFPPGARYDPIGPRGLPGWNPDDFQRSGPGNVRPPHPDIQPPGPGGGVDFDSMFG